MTRPDMIEERFDLTTFEDNGEDDKKKRSLDGSELR